MALTDAYPFQFCTSSGGPDGYVDKTNADVHHTLSGDNKVLIKPASVSGDWKCATIDYGDEIEIDESVIRDLVDSQEDSCPACISRWE